MNNTCIRDTDGDGDCARCQKIGCPLLLFKHCMIDQVVMSSTDIAKFKANAEKFEYRESWSGIIRGWRNKEGKVLIEKLEPLPF